MRDDCSTVLTEPHFVEAKRGDEGPDAVLCVLVCRFQNLVLARCGFDLLHRPQTGFLDEVVVWMKVQGAQVAVVDTSRLFVEAGGEDLGLRQVYGDGFAGNPYIFILMSPRATPASTFPVAIRSTFSPLNTRSKISPPFSLVTGTDSVQRTVAS